MLTVNLWGYSWLGEIWFLAFKFPGFIGRNPGFGTLVKRSRKCIKLPKIRKKSNIGPRSTLAHMSAPRPMFSNLYASESTFSKDIKRLNGSNMTHIIWAIYYRIQITLKKILRHYCDLLTVLFNLVIPVSYTHLTLPTKA